MAAALCSASLWSNPPAVPNAGGAIIRPRAGRSLALDCRRRSHPRSGLAAASATSVVTSGKLPPRRDVSTRVYGSLLIGGGGGPLVSPSDQWGMWTALFATGAFGIWSERSTEVGKALSGALVSTLVGLAASSLGIVSSQAPAYNVVLEYLLPLSIPLLLFNADLRLILRSTGTLLLAFLLGSGCLYGTISDA